MTFEEFFIKKKIDLAQLRRAKPDLYEEFQSHYVKMGEKSFDHTKKYWFNRLRKDYLLRESDTMETKAVTTAAAVPASSRDISTTSAKNTSPAAAPPTGLSSMSPSGFKPRFKPGVTKPAEPEEPIKDKPTEPTENKPTASEASQKAAPPTGFKPRFKPGVTKPAAPAEPAKDPGQQEPTAEPDSAKEAPEQTPAKPLGLSSMSPSGFKPRFKPGITNKKNEDNE